MEYTREITLDIYPSGELPVVRVKQGDGSTRFIQISLTKNGLPYTIEEQTQVIFRCDKPDGTSVILDSMFLDTELGRYLVTVNNNNTITVELVSQVTTAVGRCYCDICLVNGGELSTIPFSIIVARMPNATVLAVSTNDFRTVTNLIAQAEGMMEGVEQSICTLTIGTAWSGAGPYTQQISTITGYDITAATKVDLTCTNTVLAVLEAAEVHAIYVENNNGVLTVYAIGEKPTQTLSVQASLYETTAA